ncbi:MAG: hypothetical protein WC386_00080 [Candidatus Paceibacterota bacterium]|jgi:hypothetical protein
MIEVVSAQDRAMSAPVREQEEAQKVSSMMRGYTSLYGEEIIRIIRQDDRIDFNSVKGIEIETLFGLAVGYSRGASKFIYLSANAGMIDKLFLFLRKKEPNYSLCLEGIGKRKITANIFL